MRLDRVAGGARRVSQWSAVALGVSIPVSTALDNVLLVITLGAWALSGSARDVAKYVFKIKELRYPLWLFAGLALGTLYGEGTPREAFSTLAKYADLLFIPVFAMIFREQNLRTTALHALAITIAIVVVLSYLIYWQLLPAMPFITGTVASPTVFKLKITHNILLAFGAFLFVWLGSTCAHRRLRLVWFALALLAVLNVLFLVKGATGYVTLGGLIILLAWDRLRGRGLAYGIAGLAALLAVLLAVPNPFQARVTLIAQEVQLWRTDVASTGASSSGLRLEFYHGTLNIIAAHPLTGVGTGGFPAAYARQVKGSGKAETHNPHNEFLHIAVQIGMVGLLLLIAMFWQQWRAARYLDTPMQQALARGLVLTMVSGCMVNSMLLDHAEGLFYAWLCGLLYGGLIGDLRGDLTGDLSGLKYAERETLRDTSAASPTHT